MAMYCSLLQCVFIWLPWYLVWKEASDLGNYAVIHTLIVTSSTKTSFPGNSLGFLFGLVLWDTVSCTLDWAWTYYVDKTTWSFWSSCLYFSSAAITGRRCHENFKRCWGLTEGFMKTRRALCQWSCSPISYNCSSLDLSLPEALLPSSKPQTSFTNVGKKLNTRLQMSYRIPSSTTTKTLSFPRNIP